MFEFIGNFIANLDFFQVWFMVSPFIILKQYLDKKAYKMVMSNLEEHVNDSWDNQYKQIIKQYGSMDNYMENFLKDYNIMRSQVAKIYERISMINREYMSKTDRLLERLEEGKADINEAIMAVKMIKRGNCTVTDDLLTYINAFLIQEEEAHSPDKKIEEIIEAIDERYKNDDIYKECYGKGEDKND